MITYGSVCSGIEATTVAWEPLGWKAAWFSEIKKFPKAVLHNRFPTIEDLGDMTTLERKKKFRDSKIDLLVGGTPCQPYSINGKKQGLSDERGSLMLAFCKLAKRSRARWVLWENVPGVLSSNSLEAENGTKHHDFGAFLWELGKCGYGFAYRVLDARFFEVAQRRKRVFVVGYLGDSQPAWEVLFGEESGPRTPESGEEVQGNGEDSLQPVPKTPRISPKSSQYSELTTNGGSLSFCLKARGIGCYNPTSETYITEADGRTRHLTPVEWERLMGFEDNFTRISWEGRPEEECPDMLRYMALGNSMAVPVMRWLGERIEMVDQSASNKFREKVWERTGHSQ
jgi:DNA (cytosine-5)-methyltransferase 1